MGVGKLIAKYKHISVKKPATLPMFADEPRTYHIENNKTGNVLARVYYWPKWRQYVCEFYHGCIWSTSCLTDVQDALNKIKELEGV